MTQSVTLENLSPDDLAEGLREARYVLIDVREAHEHNAERIASAHLHPLSRFDPAALPQEPGREIVLHCGTGKRSALAAAQCGRVGRPVTRHLAGGLLAWKARGLPTLTGQPA